MRFACAVLASCAVALGVDAPSAREIVERSVARDQGNWARARDYMMTERGTNREFDSNGKVKSTKSETREWMFIEGEPFHHLVAKDDKPLPPGDQKKEDERLRKFTEERRREDASRKQKRLAEREKHRAQNREFLQEVPKAYNLRIAGEDRIDGHDTWKIEATPKPDFKSNVKNAWMLSKFRGTLWIDKRDFEWVKVDCESIDTVRIGLFLLRLNKGAHIQVDQTRVNDEVWLMKRFAVRYDVRLLGKRENAEDEQVFSNFKKFSADSKIVSIRQQ